MGEIVIESASLKDAAEKIGSGFLLAGPIVGALGATAVERVSNKIRSELQPTYEPNTEMRELADQLDAMPVQSHLKLVESEEQPIHSARIGAETASQLRHVTQPHTNAPPVERPAPNDGVTLQGIAKETIKQGLSATQWIAGTTLKTAQRPFRRGTQIDERIAAELEVNPDQQDTVKMLVDNFDRPPVVNNMMTVLVGKVASEQSRVNKKGTNSPRDEVQGRIITMLSGLTDLSDDQIKYALRRPGPQRLLPI